MTDVLFGKIRAGARVRVTLRSGGQVEDRLVLEYLPHGNVYFPGYFVEASMVVSVSEMVTERFSQEDLRAAFESVADPRDWRAPIYCVIKPEEREVVAAAIMHYTATEAHFGEPVDGDLLVEADGYRAGPAGP